MTFDHGMRSVQASPAAQQLLARRQTRDQAPGEVAVGSEMEPANEAAVSSVPDDDLIGRIEMLETVVAYLAMAAGEELPSENEGSTARENGDRGEVLKPTHVVGSMGDLVSDALPDISDVQARNEQFWSAERNVTGGSGSQPPNSRRAESGSYLPGSQNIDNVRRLSTVGKVEGAMGQPGKMMTTDAERAYRSANARMQSAIALINEKNAAWHSATASDPMNGKHPGTAVREPTRDQCAPDSVGPVRLAGHTVIATAAEINRKNRAHKWGS
jgi:hypothetical protein